MEVQGVNHWVSNSRLFFRLLYISSIIKYDAFSHLTRFPYQINLPNNYTKIQIIKNREQNLNFQKKLYTLGCPKKFKHTRSHNWRSFLVSRVVGFPFSSFFLVQIYSRKTQKIGFFFPILSYDFEKQIILHEFCPKIYENINRNKAIN